jgi:hypothetical protein
MSEQLGVSRKRKRQQPRQHARKIFKTPEEPYIKRDPNVDLVLGDSQVLLTREEHKRPPDGRSRPEDKCPCAPSKPIPKPLVPVQLQCCEIDVSDSSSGRAAVESVKPMHASKKKNESEKCAPDQFAPKVFHDLIGNRKTWSTFRAWVRQGRQSAPIALLTGPPGVGKTSGTIAILREEGFRVIIEVNASDQRTADKIVQLVSDAVLRKGLRGPQAVLIDEIDGCYDANGVASVGSALLKFCKDHPNLSAPIVCLGNDLQSSTIKSLRGNSRLVLDLRLYRLDVQDLVAIIMRVSSQFQWLREVPSSLLYAIAQQASGDARRLINMLTMMSVNKTQQTDVLGAMQNDPTLQIFDASKSMLYLDTTALPDISCKQQYAVRVSDRFYQQDAFIMEGMFHENYLEAIARRLQPYPEAQLATLLPVAQRLSDGDVCHFAEDTSLAARLYANYACTWPMVQYAKVEFTKLPGMLSTQQKVLRAKRADLQNDELLKALLQHEDIRKKKSLVSEKIRVLVQCYDLRVSDMTRLQNLLKSKSKIPKWVWDFVQETGKRRLDRKNYGKTEVMPCFF